MTVAASFASASNVMFVGGATYAYVGSTAVLTANEVANFDSVGFSGTLHLELWAFGTPYNGTQTTGHKLAEYSLGQLVAGFNLSSISSGTISYFGPPDGTWYFALLLTEYTGAGADAGYVPRDHIDFATPVIIGVPSTAALAIEYYNASQDHYFISDLQPDIDALDSGRFAGWVRTGYTILVYNQPTGFASPVCRFYIPPAYGDSHFYSASPIECAQVVAKFPFFNYEAANVFYIDLPDTTTGVCPAGDIPVYRVWDGRVDTNHRYTNSTVVVDQMKGLGWIAEGYGPGPYYPIMCAPQ